MQQAIEQAAAEERFTLPQLHAVMWARFVAGDDACARAARHLRSALAPELLQHVELAILRHCFFIELVKVPKIDSTKYRVRWYQQLDGDPRWCSFDECRDLADDLLVNLPAWLADADHLDALRLFPRWTAENRPSIDV